MDYQHSLFLDHGCGGIRVCLRPVPLSMSNVAPACIASLYGRCRRDPPETAIAAEGNHVLLWRRSLHHPCASHWATSASYVTVHLSSSPVLDLGRTMTHM